MLTISSDEQLFVYLLNKARHDPQQYQVDQNLPVSLDGVQAQPPLAANTDLFDSAKFHATEMAMNDYFGHQSTVTGDWPNKMAEDQGYVLPNYFPSDSNNIESIAAGTLSENPQDVIDQLVIDEGVPSLGHRLHLLSIGQFYEQSREIGIGHAFNKTAKYRHYWAVHATFSNASDTFLTGVVYQDANQNQEFGLNEGLAGVTVTLVGKNLQTQSNAAGGWSIKVPGPGTYNITVSGGSFVGTATASVVVASQNREVDFISGNAGAAIDFGPLSPNPSGVNLPPVNKLPTGPINIQQDVALGITGVSVSDPDAGTDPVSVQLSVTHGTLIVSTTVLNGLTAQQIAGNNSDQVTLNGPIAKINATLAASQGLVYQAAVGFTGTDTLTMLSNDLSHNGTGNAQTDTDSVAISIQALPIAAVPVLTLPPTAVNSVKGAKVSVGAGATFTDSDSSNFAGGSVTVRIAAGVQKGDVLTLASVGTKTGQINLSGTKLLLGKTVIGKLTGGTKGAPLVIQFTANVPPDSIQTVVQNVTLKSSSKRLIAGSRSIEFVATDPGQLSSAPVNRQVNVQV